MAGQLFPWQQEPLQGAQLCVEPECPGVCPLPACVQESLTFFSYSVFGSSALWMRHGKNLPPLVQCEGVCPAVSPYKGTTCSPLLSSLGAILSLSPPPFLMRIICELVAKLESTSWL